jgi:ABC-2 type transport system permease protein
MMIPRFTIFPVIKDPTTTFATVLSLIPAFTPFLMLMRQASPERIPAWQRIVGIGGALLATVAMVWAGGRIFRVGLLVQGKTPRAGEPLRWAVRGRDGPRPPFRGFARRGERPGRIAPTGPQS